MKAEYNFDRYFRTDCVSWAGIENGRPVCASLYDPVCYAGCACYKSASDAKKSELDGIARRIRLGMKVPRAELREFHREGDLAACYRTDCASWLGVMDGEAVCASREDARCHPSCSFYKSAEGKEESDAKSVKRRARLGFRVTGDELDFLERATGSPQLSFL